MGQPGDLMYTNENQHKGMKCSVKIKQLAIADLNMLLITEKKKFQVWESTSLAKAGHMRNEETRFVIGEQTLPYKSSNDARS